MSKTWVIVVHGCNKDTIKTVDIINTDPDLWCKKNYSGELIFDSTLEIEYSEEEYLSGQKKINMFCPIMFHLDNDFKTFKIDGEKYAKKFDMLHNSCGLYLTFVDKENNSVNEIMKNIRTI